MLFGLFLPWRRRSQTQEKAAIPGLRLGVPFVPNRAPRGELQLGTNGHTEFVVQAAVRLEFYSKLPSLQSPYGNCHQSLTFKAKLCL